MVVSLLIFSLEEYTVAVHILLMLAQVIFASDTGG